MAIHWSPQRIVAACVPPAQSMRISVHGTVHVTHKGTGHSACSAVSVALRLDAL